MVTDAAEDIGEPGTRIDIIQAGGDDQGIHRRRALPTAIRSGEQPGLSSNGDAPKCAFRRIVAQANSAIAEGATEALPSLQHVVHALATSAWRDSFARVVSIQSSSSATSGAILAWRAV